MATLARQTAPKVTVVAAPRRGAAARFDAAQPERVVRLPSRVVMPTPTTLGRVRRLAVEHRAEVVVLGAAWPLGELAAALRRHPGVAVVALTHGLEAGLATAGLGGLVRRATRHCAAATTISDHTERCLRGHLAASRVVRLPPGVDGRRFTPRVDGARLRARWGVPSDAPLVGCVSRLVPRKGQDTLLAAWPAIHRRHPAAWLVLVGAGPLAGRLRAAVRQLGPDGHVVLAGEVPPGELPQAYGALDLFAMPCRTRLAGLDVEGLGIVYLEAQACGVPVIAGRSGGAPETLRPGKTGLVVDGRDPRAVATAVSGLLGCPGRRRRMGAAGRRWVEHRWTWPVVVRRFRQLLWEVVR